MGAQLDLLTGYALRDAQSFRNDRELMTGPFFTPGRRPVYQAVEHRWNEGGVDYYIRNSPGEDGLPTVFDEDILIYIQTMIMAAVNRGEPVSPNVRFHIHDCLKAIRRRQGGTEYRLFHQSLKRLKGTTVFTNITSGDLREDGGFGWIQSFRLGKKVRADGKETATYCEVTLCDWLFNAVVKEKRILALEPEYFDLENGLERKLYQIVRAHLGQKHTWKIGLERLLIKTGYASPMRRFKFEIKQMIERDPFPQWTLQLTTDSRLIGPVSNLPVAAGERGPLYLQAVRR